MKNEEIIQECIDVLLGIFRNYKKNPTWEKLQLMFKQTLYLGIEIGKREVYKSNAMKGESK